MKEKTDDSLQKCLDFLNDIGIPVIFRSSRDETFLPGLSIENGAIFINKDNLKYPGDILHEAGHIAIVPAADRLSLNAESIAARPNREAEEMMSIAWSYAACMHLQLDPYFVFHENGYRGGGNYIADNFKNKQYFGLPMLQWAGMTYDEKNAAEKNTLPYPAMIKWLRD